MKDSDVVQVPGAAPVSLFRQRHSGFSAMHVLVVDYRYRDDERDVWTCDVHIEHPASCPTFCHWAPEGRDYWGEWNEEHRGHVEHGCQIEYEMVYNGFDSLCDTDGLEWRTRAAWRDLDGDAHPEIPGLEATLPEGRYLVQGWWHDGYGSGEYGGQGDSDSSFTLLGPETPLALTYPPNLLNPHVHFDTRPAAWRWPPRPRRRWNS